MLFLQPCTEQDIRNAALLMCRVYSEPPWNEKWSLERAEKRIESFLSGISARGWAMIIDTAVIGYLFGRMDVGRKGDVFFVNEIFVDPRYQRKGSGSMALGELAEELKKLGVKKIELHTLSEDISFYEKNGFVPSSFLYLEKDV
jgi:GNAT superfamily N-acetyltransferase